VSANAARSGRKGGTRGVPRAVREQLILDVAGQVFARSGFHAGSMDEIASLAGVSKPMLYAYFGSKEGLYLAYIDRNGRELLDRLLGAAGTHQSPVERLRARITEFLAFVEEHRDGWTVLFREAASSQPLADQVAVLRGQITDAVRRMLDSPVPPALDDADADAIAHMIVGAGESLANWWLDRPEIGRDDAAERYVELVQAVVGAALRRKEAARPRGGRG
jgi:AcrR family transcriptional regulator